MMSVFRDKQIRLAMLLLYGLAALCLALAHAERVFADPTLERAQDRATVCLSQGDASQKVGSLDCGLCADAPAYAVLAHPSRSRGLLLWAQSAPPAQAIQTHTTASSPPLGSRAPPFLS